MGSAAHRVWPANGFTHRASRGERYALPITTAAALAVGEQVRRLAATLEGVTWPARQVLTAKPSHETSIDVVKMAMAFHIGIPRTVLRRRR
jgi:hypothetical protein